MTADLADRLAEPLLGAVLLALVGWWLLDRYNQGGRPLGRSLNRWVWGFALGCYTAAALGASLAFSRPTYAHAHGLMALLAALAAGHAARLVVLWVIPEPTPAVAPGPTDEKRA